VTAQVDSPANDEEAASPVETESATTQPDPATDREGSFEDRVAIETQQDLVIAQVDTPETDSEEASLDEPDETAPDQSVDGGDVDPDTSDSTPSPVVVDEPQPAGDPESTVTLDTQPASENVRRALLTDGIDGNEPVNTLQGTIGIDPGNLRTVFFFTELRGLGGERIIHRWRHMGTTIAEVPFNVRADGRWRVYSSKRISADQSGSWTVEVVSSDDVVLSTVAFEVETNPAN
jgi:hypothetical protein